MTMALCKQDGLSHLAPTFSMVFNFFLHLRESHLPSMSLFFHLNAARPSCPFIIQWFTSFSREHFVFGMLKSKMRAKQFKVHKVMELDWPPES